MKASIEYVVKTLNHWVRFPPMEFGPGLGFVIHIEVEESLPGLGKAIEHFGSAGGQGDAGPFPLSGRRRGG